MLFLFCLGPAQSADTIHLDKHLLTSKLFNRDEADRNVRKFNEALRKYSSVKTVIELPAGRIWISSSLLIPDNTHLCGHKDGSELIINNADGDFTEGIIVNESFYLGSNKKNFNIYLSSFTINGNGVLKKEKFIRGIFFNKVEGLVLRRMTVLNTNDEGIRVDVTNLEATSANIEISNCFVSRRSFRSANIMLRSNMNNGENSENWPSRLKNSIIKNNISVGGDYGVCLSNVTNIEVYNNTCNSNYWRGIIVSPTCSNILIRRNKIDSAGSTGIHIAYYGRNIIIDSNTVGNTLCDMSGKGYEGQGIKCYVGFENLEIKSNFCNNNATDGIAIEGGADGSTFFIWNNIVNNNRRNGIRILSGPMAVKKGGNISKGKITNNTAHHNKGDAISLSSEDKYHNITAVTIENNNLKVNKGFKKIRIQKGLKINQVSKTN